MPLHTCIAFRKPWLVLGIVSLLALSFLSDISGPLGAAGGMPYVVVVVIGLWSSTSSLVLYLAAIGSLLTVAGYALSPNIGVADWIVITNRLTALCMIWLTALLCIRRRRIEQQHKLLSVAIKQSHNAVVITDPNGTIQYVNPQFTEITGYSYNEAIRQNPSILKSGKTTHETYQDLWKTITSGRIWRGELLNKRKSGEYYWASDVISPIVDERGHITHFLATQHDVTQVHNLSEELNYHATHDVLTGLLNRREFEQRLSRVVSGNRRNGASHALSFMDLDRFKIVNDTCGHTAGDELLRQISVLLQSRVRRGDTLARLGGDEFGLIMEHCDLEQASLVAEKVRLAIEEFRFECQGQTFKLGISIGVVAIPSTEGNIDTLLARADAACYRAKDLGRNRIHIFVPERDIEAREAVGISWKERILNTLEGNRFQLDAQVIAPLATEPAQEVLVAITLRLFDDNGETIAPGSFVPAATRYQLLSTLDKRLISTLFAWLGQQSSPPSERRLYCIPVFGQSIRESGFVEFIMEQTRCSDVESNGLCFEIAEETVSRNPGPVSEFARTLRDIGCKVALREFGGGLASFGYVRKLHVHYVKLDTALTTSIAEDSVKRATVRYLADVAHTLGAHTIADEVHDSATATILGELGVQYVQGDSMRPSAPLLELG